MTLPNTWSFSLLKNVTVKIQDGNYGANYPKQEEFISTGIPFLTSKAINGSNKIDLAKINFISNEKHVELDKAHIKPDDVLFTNRGARVGAVAIVPQDFFVGNIGPQLTLIRTNRSKLNPYYLYCYLQSGLFKKQIHQMDSGSAMNFFGIVDTGKFKILMPPLPEQRKIAAILSTWDEAIDLTAQLIAAKQRRKQALMQRLLTGKVRFPGFEEEWELYSAGSLFESISIKNNDDNEQLLAATQDKGVLPRDMLDTRVMSPEGSTKGYKLVVPGNFIISLRSFQGGLEYSAYRGLISPAYTVLQTKKKIIDDFYRYYFKSYDFIGRLAIAVIGIRDGKQISYEDFCSLRLPYPNLQEQTDVADILCAVDQELDLHHQKLTALRHQKQGLMQQLLTGKVRVTGE